MSSELQRNAERDEGHKASESWGSYLRDRQFGTAREDY